jgi:cyclase
MASRFAVLALFLCTATAGVAEAGRVSSKEYDILTLADGVHGFVWKDPSAQPVEGNALFIVNDRDVVVVDTGLLPATTRAMAAELRKLTDKPVRFVVNTHWHDDHTNGNGIFHEIFPEAQFVAHANTRRDHIEQTIEARPRNLKAFEAQVLKYARFAETGKDEEGKDIAPDRRERIRTFVATLNDSVADTRRVKDLPADLTIDRELVLYRGARTIEIRWLGRGNTRGDLVVVLPKERIVVTGDLLVHPIPFMYGSYYAEWPETLAKVDALPVDTLFLMHGAPQGNRDYLRKVRDLLRYIAASASQVASTDLPGEAAARTVDMKAWKEAFAGDNKQRQAEFDAYVVGASLERAIRQARKEPGAFEQNLPRDGG